MTYNVILVKNQSITNLANKHFMITLSPKRSFINSAFYPEKPAINNITSLYNRHHDEPDFDCEFLLGDSLEIRGNENMLDPDPDEGLKLF